MNSLFYDLVFLIYALFMVPFLLFKGKWHKGMSQRMGKLPPDLFHTQPSGNTLWIHAVSLGEVLAIEGLIRELGIRFPEARLVLSVTTMTGHEAAQTMNARRLNNRLTIIWSPLDFSRVTRHFIKTIKPCIYIAAETELWPNLFHQLKLQGIPVMVVNGRISDRAWPSYRSAALLLQPTLDAVCRFAMQSPNDARRIIALGADPQKVCITGNIKFDNTPSTTAHLPPAFVTEPLRLLLGASTHPGEEELLLKAYLDLREHYPHLRLALAPRHPERAEAVARAIRSCNLEPVLYPQDNPAALKPGQVLLINKIGHLLTFYQAACVIFVGKSLTVKGGHNIIEPALFAKPVIIGPHMDNFRDVTAAFLAGEGILQIDSADQLTQAIRRLLTDTGYARRLGSNAAQVVRNQKGATRRTLDLIFETIKESPCRNFSGK